MPVTDNGRVGLLAYLDRGGNKIKYCHKLIILLLPLRRLAGRVRSHAMLYSTRNMTSVVTHITTNVSKACHSNPGLSSVAVSQLTSCVTTYSGRHRSNTQQTSSIRPALLPPNRARKSDTSVLVVQFSLLRDLGAAIGAR